MPIDRLTAHARIGERRRIRRAALDCIGALIAESDKYPYHADAIVALERVVADHESDIESLENVLWGMNEIGAAVNAGALETEVGVESAIACEDKRETMNRERVKESQEAWVRRQRVHVEGLSPEAQATADRLGATRARR